MSKILGYISKTGHGTHFRETITPELEALTWGGRKVWTPVQAALEHQAAPEPYGHVTTHTVTGQQFFYRYPSPPYLDNAKECIAVYAASVVPLTDEQLAKIAVEDEFLLYCDQYSFNEIARAIEAAHGITGASK